jgi:hypothetical protein
MKLKLLSAPAFVICHLYIAPTQFKSVNQFICTGRGHLLCSVICYPPQYFQDSCPLRPEESA